MKCRTCGHEEAHDFLEQWDADRETLVCHHPSECACSEQDRQIAALRAGLEDVHSMMLRAADPCDIYDRIDAALKEAE